MLKKTIKYVDYNGTERTEDFFFNLSKAELMEMETSVNGGLYATLQKVSSTQDVPAIMKIFKELILNAFGEKSMDGRRFIKSKEISDNFSQTEAFSDLYMELATDSEKAAEFVNGIIPAALQSEVEKEIKKQQTLEPKGAANN